MKYKFLYRLRKNLSRIKDDQLELLLANFDSSKQKIDIEKRTPVINDFFRTKVDVKPWKEDKNFDWTNKEKIIDSIATNFDMPTWALYNLEGKKGLSKELNKYNEVFIYQLKGCNIFCKWCFVDDFNKNGKQDNNAMFFSIPKIIDEFEKERERRNGNLYRLRASGGEPTILLEQWLCILKELEKRELSDNVHLQSDTNLTTGHFNEELERQGILEKNILNKIAEYKNFGLLTSFKGTDRYNFHENTRASGELLDEQVYTFKKLVKAGVDAYPFFYNPNPETLEKFLERLAKEVGENIYLKSWIFPLKIYEPVKERLEKLGIDAKKYEQKLIENFKAAEDNMKELLWKKFNIEYKKSLRAGIKLGK